MSATRRNVVIAICVLIFASLACSGESNPPTIIEENEHGVLGEFDSGPKWTPTINPTRTPKPAQNELTEAELGPPDPIMPGTCAWIRTQDSQNFPEGDVGPNMIVRAADSGYGVETQFFHSPGSASGEQVFTTIHEFFFGSTLIPGEPEHFTVFFQWFNTGDPGSSSLVKAGGVAMVSIGDFKVEARRSDINIRTEPKGYVANEGMWNVPEGKVGDKFTITQHASTGSFGVNVRYYYEYTCQ